MLRLIEKGEFGIQRRVTGVGKEWKGMTDNPAVIVLFCPLDDTKIADRCVMNSDSVTDLAPNL
jgi:hypothetical protein